MAEDPLNHIVPASPYGISSNRFVEVENPLIPLPQRNVMLAANKLNDYRYDRLTEKQRVFIDVYLSSGFNASDAAKRSGFCNDVPKDNQYEKACATIGRRLTKSKHIAYGIQLALDYHAERSKIQTDALIAELGHVAFANMGDYFANDGDGDPYLRMPEDHERAKLGVIKELTVDSYVEGRGETARQVKSIKFKLHDKLSAIEKLLKIAAAKGDPAVAGFGDSATVGAGAPTVNVFNILPVPSGEFIPAPAAVEQYQQPEQYQIPKPPEQGLTPQQRAISVHVTPPHAPQEPVAWVKPETAQRRSLTIDHE